MINQLKYKLEQKGLSQKEFAEMINVTPQAVSRWLNGDSRPSQDNLVMIYKVLGLDYTREMIENSAEESLSPCQFHIDEIKTYDDAIDESLRVLDVMQIEKNYSHAIYYVFTLILPIAVAVARYNVINHKASENASIRSEFHDALKSLFVTKNSASLNEEVYLKNKFIDNFFDILESESEPGETKTDDDFIFYAMEEFFILDKAIDLDESSPLYCELRVALTELLRNI